MSKVGSNIVLGNLWVTAGIGMYISGSNENQIGAAILIVLGFMFYWAAYKIYKDPKLAKKNKKSVVQQMTDPNYKNTMKNNKKKR